MAYVYDGGCHCGSIRIRITKSAPIDRLTDCNCSICTKKGILHAPVEEAELQIIKGAETVSTYRFGSGAAQHCFCPNCGIHVFGRPRNSPERKSVNARCLDDFRSSLSDATIVLFDGQNHPKDQ